MNDKDIKATLYDIKERIDNSIDEAVERKEETLEGAYYTLVDRLEDLSTDLSYQIIDIVSDLNKLADSFERYGEK